MEILYILIFIFILIICYSFDDISYNQKHKDREIEHKLKQNGKNNDCWN